MLLYKMCYSQLKKSVDGLSIFRHLSSSVCQDSVRKSTRVAMHIEYSAHSALRILVPSSRLRWQLLLGSQDQSSIDGIAGHALSCSQSESAVHCVYSMIDAYRYGTRTIRSPMMATDSFKRIAETQGDQGLEVFDILSSFPFHCPC